MKNIAIEILKKETEYENRIALLEAENKRLIEENKMSVNNAIKLRLSKRSKYCSLKDFCRISTYLLFIKETELKQWLFQQGYLVKEGDKYVSNNQYDVCIMVGDEVYIKYEFIRKQVFLLRTLVYIGDSEDVRDLVDEFDDKKEAIVEQMANTVYVSYKQKSHEFRDHKSNKFFIKHNIN